LFLQVGTENRLAQTSKPPHVEMPLRKTAGSDGGWTRNRFDRVSRCLRPRRFQKSRQYGRRLFPFARFAVDLFATRARKAIELRPPIIIRIAPRGCDVTLLFKLQQGR